MGTKFPTGCSRKNTKFPEAVGRVRRVSRSCQGSSRRVPGYRGHTHRDLPTGLRRRSECAKARPGHSKGFPGASKNFQKFPVDLQPSKDSRGPSTTFQRSPMLGHPRTSTGLPRLYSRVHGLSKTIQGRPTTPSGLTETFQRLPIVCQALSGGFRGSSCGLLRDTFQGLAKGFQGLSGTAQGLPTKGCTLCPKTSSPPPRAAGRLTVPATEPRGSHSGVAIVREFPKDRYFMN